jgi:hypothetical protein
LPHKFNESFEIQIPETCRKYTGKEGREQGGTMKTGRDKKRENTVKTGYSKARARKSDTYRKEVQ